MTQTAVLQISKIKKAREDIVRILDRYMVTLPEIMGIYNPGEDEDDKVWKSVKRDYERAQRKVFQAAYPDLAPAPRNKR